jgi:LytS/YehU family sensor histidine kinase
MPVFVFRKKYFSYVLVTLSVIFLMVLVKFNLTYYLVSSEVWPEGPEIINSITLNYTIDMMIGELYVMTFVTAIKVTMDWLIEHKRLNDLEKLQLETELQFLRTQVSPHFFLNTLNNIYALAIAKSNKTPKVIIKLSELMKYMLYETKVQRQSLEKEILNIQNYLDIERIRSGEKLEIEMEISGEIANKTIAPMLILCFIENAFKHGVNKNIKPVTIKISFTIEEDFLYFSISNPKPAVTEFNKRIEPTGGIGLENVKKRLALGYNSNEYNLTIKDQNDIFVVELKIKVQGNERD